jgi:two-component system chemotaxis response regulator CheB
MVSAHTKHGADVTVQALRHGAFDFIAKPSGLQSEENLVQLRRHLTCKIRLFMSERARQVMSPSPSIPTQSQQYRKNRQQTIQAIVVATSTGGPRALGLLLPDLSRCVDLPILIVQHMPPKFTKSLAESLSRTSAVPVSEAEDGERLEEKRIYLAPGGMHMILRREGEDLFLGLNEQPPENGCRPSADVLFRSTAAALRSGVLAIVLSGMGRDGTIGLGAIKRAGGYAIVQDESTSVVWGMPGSAVEAGLADEILPLGEIAAAAKAIVCTVNED